jgi:hypothetical protein
MSNGSDSDEPIALSVASAVVDSGTRYRFLPVYCAHPAKKRGSADIVPTMKILRVCAILGSKFGKKINYAEFVNVAFLISGENLYLLRPILPARVAVGCRQLFLVSTPDHRRQVGSAGRTEHSNNAIHPRAFSALILFGRRSYGASIRGQAACHFLIRLFSSER